MAGIGVITPGFATNLERKGVPTEKIALLPDYIDPEFVQPGPARQRIPRRQLHPARCLCGDVFRQRRVEARTEDLRRNGSGTARRIRTFFST